MKQRGIMIIGAGVVGTATGKGLIKKGCNVIFIDKARDVISRLNGEGFSAYSPEDFDLFDMNMNISMFCVNTPFIKSNNVSGGPTGDDSSGAIISKNSYHSTDLGDIVSSIITHAKWLKKKYDHYNGKCYHLVAIRSTVLPGTTEGILLPLIEKYSGLKVGKDFGLCMQPEFLRNISAEHDFLHPRLVVIGQYDRHSGDLLEEIYSRFDCEISRVELRMAEFLKYVNNCFNATKISFSNEMWLLGQMLGIDANFALALAAKSAEGLWNQYYGLEGGRPYDGRCLPKDAESFSEFAKNKGFDMRLLSSCINLNKIMEERARPGRISNEIRAKQK
jgi:UDPglucose 6-dehydrogenase